MRVLIVAGLAGAALFSLSACSKPAPAAGGGAAAPSGPVTLQAMPHRKPGLWRQAMTMDGSNGGGPSSEICIDEASEARLSMISQHIAGAHCDTPQLSRNFDGSVSFANNCDMGPNGKAQTTGTIKGDFNSSYTAVMHTKYIGSPVASLNGDHTLVITASWVGPCAPGQKGGDMILANGMKMNVLDRQAAAQQGGTN